MGRRVAELAVKQRWLFFAAMAVLTALMATGLFKLEFRSTYRIWFSEGSDTLVDFDAMVDKFGSEGTVVVVFRDADRGVLNNRALASIHRLTEAFWKVDGVKRVDGLDSFSTIRGSRLAHTSGALAASAGQVAAAGDADDIFVWRSDGALAHHLVGHDGMVEHLIFAGDGQRLWSAGVDRTVRAWDLSAGEQRSVLRGAEGQISALQLSADQATIYAGTFRSVVAWDTTTGARRWRTPVADDYVTAVQPSADGAQLYVASKDLYILGATDGQRRATWQGHTGFINALALTADGETLYSIGDDGRLIAWDVTSGVGTTRLHLPGLYALSLAVGADGSAIVGFSDGSIRMMPPGAAHPTVSRIHSDWVTDLTVGPDGMVFSASRDRDVAIHAPGQGPRVVHLQAHRAAVRRVLLDADRLYTMGDDGDVFGWDTGAQAIVSRLRRTAYETPPPAAPITGDPTGTLELINNFRFPVQVQLGGRAHGEIPGGATRRFEGLPVPQAKRCEDDADCGAAGYCNFELDDPVCAVPMHVGATVAGTSATVWATVAVLSDTAPLTLQIPAAGAYGVTPVAGPPVDPSTSAGALIAAHPDVGAAVTQVLGQAAAVSEAFITPRDAAAIAAIAGRSSSAYSLLTTHAQAKLTPLDLPMQPFRLREAAYHLMRQPQPPAKGVVVNQAFDTTMISVRMHQGALDQSSLSKAIALRAGVEAAIADEGPRSGFDYHLVGDVIQDTKFVEYAQRDFMQLFPLFFVAIFGMLVLLYRRLSGVLLPLVLVLLGVVIAMGASAHLGAALNNMTVTVPQIVLAACIGDSVHIFNSYVELLRAGSNRHDAAIEATATNWTPCLLTSVSTAVGFFSLSWSDIAPVGTFGWMAGIGVITAFVISFCVMPGVMAMLPTPRLESRTARFDAWIDRALIALAGYVNRTTGAILVIAALISIYCLVGFGKLSFDSNPLRFFDEASSFRRACAFIEDHISGPNSLKLVLDTKTPGGTRTLAHLRELAALTDHIRASSDSVVGCNSLSDTMKSMNRVMNRDLDENHRLPDTDARASGYYNAYTFSLPAGLDVTHQVSADESASLLDVRFKDRSSGWMLDWGTALSEWVEGRDWKSQLTITGVTWLFSNMLREISRGFFENVGSAVLIICCMMLLISGSLRLGLVACSANVMPLALTVGLLSRAGESLDTSILVSCCIAMGIVVDDSIHYIVKYRRSRAKGLGHDQATVDTLRHVGKAVVFTTVVLVTGLGLFALSDFVLNRNAGLTVAIMLTFGMAFDLTVLPALIKLTERR